MVLDKGQATASERIRHDARVYITGLAERLEDLSQLTQSAGEFDHFDPENYGRFKNFFLLFLKRVEESQILCAMIEETLTLPERLGLSLWWNDRDELETHYHTLRLAVLRLATATTCSLLKVWEDRLTQGNGLPYGSAEMFEEMLRAIEEAKDYLAESGDGEDSIHTGAIEAESLLHALIDQAPRYRSFDKDSEAVIDPPPDPDDHPFEMGINSGPPGP
ncbi:MAG: hypothetical protein VB101_11860 [Rhodospirillaceae bacterium]|nr:hypothetical protein [Rhodospirillaceae bacterium]